MVTTTSAARTTSPVQGFGYSVEMSMPRSAIAAMAAGLMVVAGSDPPDQAVAASPAMCAKKPSAICERPALWVHRNNTTGLQTLAGELLGEQGKEVEDNGALGELVVGGMQEPFDRLSSERAVELAGEMAGSGLQREVLVEGHGLVVPDTGHGFLAAVRVTEGPVVTRGSPGGPVG